MDRVAADQYENQTYEQFIKDNVYNGGALCDVPEMTKVSVPMKYTGSTTYFCYHMEDESPASNW